VPRRRLRWCTARSPRTGLCAPLGISSATLLSNYPQGPLLSLVTLYTLISLCYLRRGGLCVQGSQATNVSFCLFSASVVESLISQIVPSSPRAALLCSKAPYRVRIVGVDQGNGWLFFMMVSRSTSLGCHFHRGTRYALPPRTGQVCGLILVFFFQEGEYLKTMKLLFPSVDFLSIANNLQVPLEWVRGMQSLARVWVHVSCDIRSFGAGAAISVNGLKPCTSSWEYTPANCVPAVPWDLCENDASEERRFQWYDALG